MGWRRFVVAAAAAGAASQAWAATVSGPGVVTLPDAVVSGSVGASVLGAIEDPTTGTGASTYGSQTTTLSAPGSTPIGVSAPLSCQCAVPGYGWIYSDSSATGSVNVSLLPNSSIRATASLGVAPAYGASGNVQVSAETDYYFEIVDNSNPTAILPVPIVVNAAGGYTYSVDTPGYEEFLNSDFNSSFYVSGVLTDQILWYSDIDGSLAPGSNSWSDNNTYTMYTNELYTVSLVAGFAIGMGGNEGGGTQMMSVYVDPTFAVGSGADPSQYSLVFSDGVGNAAAGAVPESSTWAMMLIGFAGLGFGARRRLAAAAVA